MMPLKFYGDGLEIEITGDSGRLELQVNAIKTLIECLDFNIAKKDDTEIEQKTYLILLDAIGAMLKLDMPAFDNAEKTNIETVKEFLSWILKQEVHKKPGYAELLDQDCGCD